MAPQSPRVEKDGSQPLIKQEELSGKMRHSSHTVKDETQKGTHHDNFVPKFRFGGPLNFSASIGSKVKGLQNEINKIIALVKNWWASWQVFKKKPEVSNEDIFARAAVPVDTLEEAKTILNDADPSRSYNWEEQELPTVKKQMSDTNPKPALELLQSIQDRTEALNRIKENPKLKTILPKKEQQLQKARQEVLTGGDERLAKAKENALAKIQTNAKADLKALEKQSDELKSKIVEQQNLLEDIEKKLEMFTKAKNETLPMNRELIQQRKAAWEKEKMHFEDNRGNKLKKEIREKKQEIEKLGNDIQKLIQKQNVETLFIKKEQAERALKSLEGELQSEQIKQNKTMSEITYEQLDIENKQKEIEENIIKTNLKREEKIAQLSKFGEELQKIENQIKTLRLSMEGLSRNEPQLIQKWLIAFVQKRALEAFQPSAAASVTGFWSKFLEENALSLEKEFKEEMVRQGIILTPEVDVRQILMNMHIISTVTPTT